MNAQLLDDRFWSKVEKTSSCWNWKACKSKFGYGRFRLNKKTYNSHRLSYENSNGIITNGLYIDHLCRNTSCVNPKHLEAVTLTENVMRGEGFGAINARKTHCKNGHEFSSENVYIEIDMKDRKGRKCKICRRKWSRQNKLQKKLFTLLHIPEVY